MEQRSFDTDNQSIRPVVVTFNEPIQPTVIDKITHIFSGKNALPDINPGLMKYQKSRLIVGDLGAGSVMATTYAVASDIQHLPGVNDWILDFHGDGHKTCFFANAAHTPKQGDVFVLNHLSDTTHSIDFAGDDEGLMYVLTSIFGSNSEAHAAKRILMKSGKIFNVNNLLEELTVSSAECPPIRAIPSYSLVDALYHINKKTRQSMIKRLSDFIALGFADRLFGSVDKAWPWKNIFKPSSTVLVTTGCMLKGANENKALADFYITLLLNFANVNPEKILRISILGLGYVGIETLEKVKLLSKLPQVQLKLQSTYAHQELAEKAQEGMIINEFYESFDETILMRKNSDEQSYPAKTFGKFLADMNVGDCYTANRGIINPIKIKIPHFSFKEISEIKMYHANGEHV